jgi:hypothetical protein
LKRKSSKVNERAKFLEEESEPRNKNIISLGKMFGLTIQLP